MISGNPAFPVPTRITPFVRHFAVRNIEVGRLPAFAQRMESLGEYGRRGDRQDARLLIDQMGGIPNMRTGEKRNREVSRRNSMALGDCFTQEFPIPPFAVQRGRQRRSDPIL